MPQSLCGWGSDQFLLQFMGILEFCCNRLGRAWCRRRRGLVKGTQDLAGGILLLENFPGVWSMAGGRGLGNNSPHHIRSYPVTTSGDGLGVDVMSG